MITNLFLYKIIKNKKKVTVMISLLFELSKWKKEAINKGLSTTSHKRLTKAGVKKPVTSYITGFNQGSDRIISKTADKDFKRGSGRVSAEWGATDHAKADNKSFQGTRKDCLC